MQTRTKLTLTITELTLTDALRLRGLYHYAAGYGSRVIANFFTGEPVERDERGEPRQFTALTAREWLALPETQEKWPILDELGGAK